ncbi:MAG: prepilin-type N-terminal cleavage/methylation domain-containing protein [Candidatus Omnitrophica bacterium]|nr:prepilin-type N-terminal cleavage/methylation domain-containing protein [Candidatus Omnitrophota bacterium]
MKKGFTLLELIVVIIIIGILGALGFIQYTKVVEKGRTAEAKDILGQIRTAQEAVMQETGSYATSMGALIIDAPTACASTHYFSYSTDGTTGTATRCSASGKSPQGAATPYTITMTYSTGTWGGSAGYY